MTATIPTPKKKSTKKTTQDTPPTEVTVIDLSHSSLPLLQQIEANVALVPTDKLVPVYSTAKKIEKRVKHIKDKIIKPELLNRLAEAQKYGSENQHREFIVGDYRVRAERREDRELNEARTHEFLREKNLETEVYDLIVESGAEALQKFLKKHKAEAKQMGLVLREEINTDKLAALVTQKKVSLDEFEGLHDVGEPTYALKD